MLNTATLTRDELKGIEKHVLAGGSLNNQQARFLLSAMQAWQKEAARRIRSHQQNRYLWGVVYKAITDITGFTAAQLHEILKVNLAGGLSTHDMEPGEFEEYLRSVREWAQDKLGLMIPLPNEVLPQ